MFSEIPEHKILAKRLSTRIKVLKTIYGSYERAKHIRTTILLATHEFETLRLRDAVAVALYKHTFVLEKETTEYMDDLHPFLPNVEHRRETFKMLLRDIKTYRRLCLQNTLNQFTMLPGYLPLDVRKYVVSYISTMPVD